MFAFIIILAFIIYFCFFTIGSSTFGGWNESKRAAATNLTITAVVGIFLVLVLIGLLS